MSIDTRAYKKRTFDFLLKGIRSAQNSLQMRDWSIKVEYGDSCPPEFIGFSDRCGNCMFDISTLEAKIWVSPANCKKQNQDPLNIVLHELAHVWLNDSRSEEVHANVLALLLEE